MESLHAEIAPFGIATTIVNPGFFRTELLTERSTNYAEPSIEDYDERRTKQLFIASDWGVPPRSGPSPAAGRAWSTSRSGATRGRAAPDDRGGERSPRPLPCPSPQSSTDDPRGPGTHRARPPRRSPLARGAGGGRGDQPEAGPRTKASPPAFLSLSVRAGEAHFLQKLLPGGRAGVPHAGLFPIPIPAVTRGS
jgi:hypothetical protein